MPAPPSCDHQKYLQTLLPGRQTHLDVWPEVHVTRPQVAEAAFLLRPAPGIDVGDAGGDPQAAAGGTGAPGAGAC